MLAFKKRFGIGSGGAWLGSRTPATPRAHSIYAAPAVGGVEADREGAPRSYLNEVKKWDFHVECRRAQAVEVQKSRNW